MKILNDKIITNVDNNLGNHIKPQLYNQLGGYTEPWFRIDRDTWFRTESLNHTPVNVQLDTSIYTLLIDQLWKSLDSQLKTDLNENT